MDANRNSPTSRQAAHDDAARLLAGRDASRGWWRRGRETTGPVPDLGLERCFGTLD